MIVNELKTRTFLGKKRYGVMFLYLLILLVTAYVQIFNNPFENEYINILVMSVLLAFVVLSASEQLPFTLEFTMTDEFIKIRHWGFHENDKFVQKKMIKLANIIAIESFDKKNILVIELPNNIIQLYCHQMQEWTKSGLIDVDNYSIEKAIRDFHQCGKSVDMSKLPLLEREIF